MEKIPDSKRQEEEENSNHLANEINLQQSSQKEISPDSNKLESNIDLISTEKSPRDNQKSDLFPTIESSKNQNLKNIEVPNNDDFNWNISNIIIKCEKCKKIPIVRLNSPFSIEYTCVSCNIKVEKSLKEVLDSTSKYNLNQFSNCQRHNAPSVKYCLTCNKNLCENCLNAHDLFAEDHNVISYYINIPISCAKHNNNLSKYCTKCNYEICNECENETLHCEHFMNIINLNSLLNDEHFKEITTNIDLLKNQFKEKNNKIKIDLLTNISNEINNVTTNINSEIEKINAKYEREINQLLNEIAQIKEKIASLEKQKKVDLLCKSEEKNKVINNLNKKIANVNEIYPTFLENNYNIFKYISILINNYKNYNGNHNYNSILNILNNTDICDMDEFIKEKAIEQNEENDKLISKQLLNYYNQTMNYFNNYLIINCNFTNRDDESVSNKINSDRYNLFSIEDNENENFKEVEKYIYENKNLIICNKCFSVPKIDLYNKDEIFISCKECNTKRIIAIDKFINDLQNISYTDIEETNIKCYNTKSHGIKSAYKKCLLCDKPYCFECLKYHNLSNPNHTIFNYNINFNIKCQAHNENYVGYCKICCRNLCYKCKQEPEEISHEKHILIFDNTLNMDKVKYIKNKIKLFYSQIDDNSKEIKKRLLLNIKNKKIKIITQYDEKIESYKKNSNKEIINLQNDIEKLNLKVKLINEMNEENINQANIQKNKILTQIDKDTDLIEQLSLKSITTNKNILRLLDLFLLNYTFYYGRYSFNTIQNIINNNKDFNFPRLENREHIDIKDIKDVEIINKKEISFINDYLLINFENKSNFDFLYEYKILPNHSNSVVSVIIIYDNRIASSSLDNSIIVYNSLTFEPDIEIKNVNKNSGVLSKIQNLKGNKIISLSLNDILIWEIYKKDYKLVKEIDGHKDLIINAIINLNETQFLTNSYDNTIKVWDANNYEFIKVISESQLFECILFYNYDKYSILISGNKRKQSLFLWNGFNYSYINDISNISISGDSECIFKINNSKILIGGDNYIYLVTLKFIDIEKEDKTFNVDYDTITIENKNFGVIFEFSYLRDNSIVFINSRNELIKLDKNLSIVQKKHFNSKDLVHAMSYRDTFIILYGNHPQIYVYTY